MDCFPGAINNDLVSETEVKLQQYSLFCNLEEKVTS